MCTFCYKKLQNISKKAHMKDNQARGEACSTPEITSSSSKREISFSSSLFFLAFLPSWI